MKRIALMLSVVAVVAGLLTGCGESKTQEPNPFVKSRVAYLSDVGEISRVEILGRDIYLSFKGDKLPGDYKIVCNAAAVNGSEALVKHGETVTGCAAWIIPEAAEAGDVSRIFYSASARRGKLK